MKQTTKKVLDAARELSEREKIRVVEELLAGLEGKADPEAEAAWTAEIERRTREIERGEVKPVSWSMVRKLAGESVYAQASPANRQAGSGSCVSP